MTERPIIFSGDMVRAILYGRKTQTRRVMKPQPSPADVFVGDHGLGMGPQFRCSYGQPGDRLWVRETMRGEYSPARNQYRVEYRAGRGTGWGKADADWCGAQDWYTIAGTSQQATRWRSPIHMPRWASRLTLDITEVRVQRVQEISEGDAVAEGFPAGSVSYELDYCDVNRVMNLIGRCAAVARFAIGWDSINAKRGFGWDANPWVWALTFKVVPPAGGTAG